MSKKEDFNTKIAPNWCPGCGNYSIWSSLKQAFVELDLEPHQIIMTYDIGCSGNGADKLNTYAFKSLHGRTIPVAIGAKIANPNMTVISTGGDGGIFEEGINHLIWAARSNYDITVIMHNNQRFALTTGQPTTTTKKGQPGKTAPYGVVENQLIPAQIALVSQASFVAKGFAGDITQLVKLIKSAVNHKGFSFLEVLQPCVTLNKVNTFEWFKQRVYKLEDKKNYDPSDWNKAFDITKESDEKIATGIIYQDKDSVPYTQRLPHRKDKSSTLVEEVKKYGIDELIKEFE